MAKRNRLSDAVITSGDIADATLPAITPAQRIRLLTRLAEYCHRTFMETPDGLKFLTQTHGIRDVSLCKTFQIGYANGTLLRVLPVDGDTVTHLKALGVLDIGGRELFAGSLVFPLWSGDGTITSLSGWHIADGQSHLVTLPGVSSGLWNGAACQRSAEILVTDTILDALTAIDAGIPDVLPLLGGGTLNAEQQAALIAGTVSRVVVVGSSPAENVLAQLAQIGIAAAMLTLPDGRSLSDYLRRGGDEARLTLRQRLMHAFAELTPSASVARSETVTTNGCERTAHGLRLRLPGRCYEVKGIARETTQLKATIKATSDTAKGFELTTLDLYSRRSREAYVKRCAALFGQTDKVIAADFSRLLEDVEAWQPQAAAALPEVTQSLPDVEARALAFLHNPNLFDELLADLRMLGVAGEEINKLVSYLAAISRKLDDPLSLMIQSRSAAGKSTLQHAVLSLTPPEDQVQYTRLTSQSLFYQGETSLSHKVLALEEAEGLGDAAYSLRALQSAKRITVATTVKDSLSGKMKSESYVVQGPVAVLMTTTSASLDEETASRFLTLTIDESKDMTETILAAQRKRETLEGYLFELAGDDVVAKHHAAQRLLEPLVVINPYAEHLSFPTHSLRARRDHKKYLTLIKTVAFLHQKQRATKELARGGQCLRYIEVSRADIARANDLACGIFGHSLDELTAQARTLLGLVHQWVNAQCAAHHLSPAQFFFTRRDVREATGWSDWQVRRHLKELEEMEYVRARCGAWGREYLYELSGDSPGVATTIAFTDPDTLPDLA